MPRLPTRAHNVTRMRPTPRDRVQHPADSPMLMFSVDALFLDAQTSPSQHPKSIHQCLQPATRVINTLMRLVHGGSEGEGWHSHSDKGPPQSTSTPGLCHKHPESDINDTIPHVKSTRKSQKLDKKNEGPLAVGWERDIDPNSQNAKTAELCTTGLRRLSL